jgi:hypothetical protein
LLSRVMQAPYISSINTYLFFLKTSTFSSCFCHHHSPQNYIPLLCDSLLMYNLLPQNA